MRPLITIILILISNYCFSQDKTNPEALTADSGKYEFKLQAKRDTSDYSEAFRMLTNQVSQNPENAEYRYFLGYTIDRLNADDGSTMFKMQREMTIKASEQFEAVNRLEPIYKGEIFLLDPYAKLTAVWGSLAAAYLSRKLIDSAKWAFSEGKKRGGFTEPFLEFNRQLLSSCDKNAILISRGDIITIPIWYLQTIENYRSDITVVDVSLIGSIWYAKYLKTERNLKLSLSYADIDTIEYKQWQSQQVSITNSNDTIQKFSWELRPTYLDRYILKGDQILLDIFQQNFYSKPFYFTNYSDSSYNLFLSPFLVNEGLVDRVTTRKFDNENDIFQVSQNLYMYNIRKLNKDDIAKSKDAVDLLSGFRWTFHYNISQLIFQENYKKAKELLKVMNERFSKDKLPYPSDDFESFFSEFYKLVEQ